MANPDWKGPRVREPKTKRRYLRSRSPRKAKLDARYSADAAEWLPGRRCAVFPSKAATQVHHVRGRLGPLLLDKRFWKGVSMEGHTWIDANRSKARKLGLLAAEGYWHVWPDDEETRRLKNLIIEITK